MTLDHFLCKVENNKYTHSALLMTFQGNKKTMVSSSSADASRVMPDLLAGSQAPPANKAQEKLAKVKAEAAARAERSR